MALHKVHVRALETAISSEEVVRALRKIILNTNIDHEDIFGMQYRNDIVHAGGLKAVLRSMKEYHDSLLIQCLACLTLSNLAFENDKTRVVVAQLGGVSLVLEAMKTHLSDEDLQFYALQLLWRLAFNDWVRDAIVKQGTGCPTRMV
ncbi:MAG: hypothetical protein SGARI_002666 [Bacillariaceae sp.]